MFRRKEQNIYIQIVEKQTYKVSGEWWVVKKDED